MNGDAAKFAVSVPEKDQQRRDETRFFYKLPLPLTANVTKR